MDIATSDRAGCERLTFSWLYEQVQRYVEGDRKSLPSKTERWFFGLGLGAAGVGLIVGATWQHWLSPRAAVVATTLLLIAEIVGLLVSAILWGRRELPQLLRSRQIHAGEMEENFGKWQTLVAELRLFPMSQRESRLRFVQEMSKRMDDRLGLLLGGTQRLGVFPVLIALYLQFRDWEWGDWGAAFDVNLVAGLLIFAMLLLYGIGWLAVGLRIRIDTYESLLRESLEGRNKTGSETVSDGESR